MSIKNKAKDRNHQGRIWRKHVRIGGFGLSMANNFDPVADNKIDPPVMVS